MAYTRQQFISKVAPMAQKDSKMTKVLASLTIAQAILESNNGNSALTIQGNALFGIKATNWRGKVWTGKTIEYYNPSNSVTITAGFRAYDSWEESIEDHSKLLTGASRYKAVIGETDYKKACNAIAKAGYATDPQYSNKLVQIIENHELYKLDEELVVNDVELSSAVSGIIKRGVDLDFNKWKRKDLIKLADVPFLVCRLAGVKIVGAVSNDQYKQAIDKLVSKECISQRLIWDERRYTDNNVRSLLIKYSKI